MAKKILLADDSITIQKVISITFASEDYDLIIVGDGEAAVKKARETKPDLIIADVAMPGKTGYEVCEAVKADPALSHIPVLLLAGTFEPLDRGEAMRVKAEDSIVKPFESQELLDRVRELLSISDTGAVDEGALPAGGPMGVPGAAESADIWSASDFLGGADEFEEAKDDGGAIDLDFLTSGGFFEEEKEKESGFTDLVINDEGLKPGAAQKEDKAPSEPARTEPAETEPFDFFKGGRSDSSFDMDSFDIFQPDDKKTEPIEMEPFEAEPLSPEPRTGLAEQPRPFWEETPSGGPGPSWAKDEQISEPDLLEIPEDAIEAGPATAASGATDDRRFAEPEAPFRDTAPAPARIEPQVSEEDVRRAVERAADKAEEKLMAGFNAKIRAAEAQVAEAIGHAAAKLEEKLRADLNAKLAEVDRLIAEAAGKAAARIEERLRSEMGSRLEKGLAIPREQVEAIVASGSKRAIEHIAWEVLPEMAERLIRTEISKVKEALIRLR